jgi:hypothetical protein
MDFLKKKIIKIFGLGLKDNFVIKVLIGIMTIVLITLMFPRGESIEYSYEVGSIWTNKDLFAPFSFPILKDAQQYETEKRQAALSVYPVFERSDAITQAQV